MGMPSKDTSPSMSDMLNNVSHSIDMDLALTHSEVMNVYMHALKRVANRSTLGPDDSIRILHITNQIMDACDSKTDPELLFRRNGHAEVATNTQ